MLVSDVLIEVNGTGVLAVENACSFWPHASFSIHGQSSLTDDGVALDLVAFGLFISGIVWDDWLGQYVFDDKSEEMFGIEVGVSDNGVDVEVKDVFGLEDEFFGYGDFMDMGLLS